MPARRSPGRTALPACPSASSILMAPVDGGDNAVNPVTNIISALSLILPTMLTLDSSGKGLPIPLGTFPKADSASRFFLTGYDQIHTFPEVHQNESDPVPSPGFPDFISALRNTQNAAVFRLPAKRRNLEFGSTSVGPFSSRIRAA